MGKKKKHSSSHIKQKEFKDRNISSLESHRRDGNKVLAPFSTLPGEIRLHSWYDECIPNILWACILAAQLDRDTYLAHFRKIVVAAKSNIPDCKDRFITHNYLALLSNDEFDAVFASLIKDPKAQVLGALALIESLPDKGHWRRHFKRLDGLEAGQILARAVGGTFDHQSEKSTDIRWMKAMYCLVTGKIHFPDRMSDRLEEYREYPNKGDMRSVRPSIRALEMTIRPFETGEEKPPGITLSADYVPSFWKEMKSSTECILGQGFEAPRRGDTTFTEEVSRVFYELQSHFDNTITTTAPDPRHDGAFGLALYALSLLLNAAAG